jgi:hypothetical protein
VPSKQRSIRGGMMMGDMIAPSGMGRRGRWRFAARPSVIPIHSTLPLCSVRLDVEGREHLELPITVTYPSSSWPSRYRMPCWSGIRLFFAQPVSTAFDTLYSYCAPAPNGAYSRRIGQQSQKWDRGFYCTVQYMPPSFPPVRVTCSIRYWGGDVRD